MLRINAIIKFKNQENIPVNIYKSDKIINIIIKHDDLKHQTGKNILLNQNM